MSTTTVSKNADRLRDAVLAMPVAQALQLRFSRIASGEVDLELPISERFTFRPGQLQATAIFAAADFAAVSAAGTLLPDGWANATIDGTIKLLAPAVGSHLLARGRVVQVGKLLSICAADVYAVRDGRETLCATWLGSARNLPPAA